MAEELKTLVLRRGQIKACVTRIQNFVTNFQPGSNINQLKTRLPNLRATFREFNDVQNQIEMVEKSAKQDKERDEFEVNYYNLESELLTLIDNSTGHLRVTTNEGVNSGETRLINPVRLPTLDLPSFSGNYLEWTAFADTFKSLIHESTLYSDIEKFHYLRSCLKGDAQKTLETISISAESYKTAWEILQKRFENKRLIIQEHVVAILNSPTLVKNSYSAMRRLLNDIAINIEALKILGQEVDKWDALIVPIITSKFDFFTRKEWESTLNSEIPLLSDLITFLTKKTLLLESMNALDATINNKNNQSKFKNKSKYDNSSIKLTTTCNAGIVSEKSHPQCYVCKGAHTLYQCIEFLNLTVAERLERAKALKVCLNCFKRNHMVERCRATPCSKCKERHNSLLHQDGQVESREDESQRQSVVSHVSYKNTQVLLSTAQIVVKNNKQNWVSCRALLDVGSQTNFITRELCDRLGVELDTVNWNIIGINEAEGKCQNTAKIHFRSRYDSSNYRINCLVLSKITPKLPGISVDPKQIQIPSNIKLADVKFYESQDIDVLLGAEVFWDVLRAGNLRVGKNPLHFQETTLGWVAGGGLGHNPLRSVVCNVSLRALDKQVKEFWEIDQWPVAVDKNETMSQEQRHCENYFKTTHKRDKDGRFIVRLPFKLLATSIGETEQRSRKRYFSLENKFRQNPSFKADYQGFIHEYLQLGHMESVSLSNVGADNSVYLPHHAVIKESSTTTKLRVVFDASAKSSTGVSLNDNLSVGPKIQDDLCAIILRFRLYQFVLTGDINKMYRQIFVAPDDRKYQRLFWRDESNLPLGVFQLKTVTYGTSCAPFTAVRCLKQLAEESHVDYPYVYPVIIHDFYMDDVLTGADSINELIKVREGLTNVLAKGKFELRKWASNHKDILPRELVNDGELNKGLVNFDKQGESKTLGLYWNCNSDTLRYEVNEKFESLVSQVTKRKVLSIVSKIYDPLNLVGPVGVKAKLLIQKMWELQLGWDENLPTELLSIWNQLLSQLENLKNFKIPRKVINVYPHKRVELHGFCDASQRAYGACVYIRVIGENGEISCNLLCAKSRVAPLKSVTIPRLELCAALLLSKLISSINNNIRTQLDNIFYWTDSTIVLAWLSSIACNLNTFVGNRVSEIQTLSDIKNWRHVSSENNPADIISRGMLPSDLINNHLWFHGPDWLTQSSCDWPTPQPKTVEIPEIKRVVVTAIRVDNIFFTILNQYSSFRKLQRVMATCLRFIHNCKYKNDKIKGEFTSLELNKAVNTILQVLQQLEFGRELTELKANRQIKSDSKLKMLNPFLDQIGLIRVGGRLRNANIEFDQKFPVVLPKHHVTRLIIMGEHENNLHAGPSATLAALRLKFWPLAGRSQVRQIIRRCYNCMRFSPREVNPIMGDLPRSRFRVARPFLNCGVDYAGRLIIKDGKSRNKRTIKAYIALFVCFATKAIHLELVSDLTSLSFLAALKRFISRRGVVENIYSDNATNFVGAHRELQNIFSSEEFSKNILGHLAMENINWHFIPARAPHFGGIWEAGIKSTKFHLKRVVGNSVLTFEEMYTLLTCIEACLNSRPLCPLSDNPSDVEVLTPGHFLIGAPLKAVPEHNLVNIQENRLARWQLVEQKRQHFWNRWSKEYLGQLQQRSKWQLRDPPAIQPGTLVLLKEPTPSLTWKRGRILEIHPGEDGVTRVVSVKVNNNIMKRAVRTLCVLPME